MGQIFIKTRIISIFLFFLTVNVISGQEKYFFDALKDNSINELEPFLQNRVELSLFDTQDLYSKKEVLSQLKNWLSSNKVLSVKMVHSGRSKDGNSRYQVGQIQTSTDIVRAFVYVSETGGSDKIKKIQIDNF